MLCADGRMDCQSGPEDQTDRRLGCQPVDRDEPPCYDGWELGEELSEIGRALGTADCDDRRSKAVLRRESRRLDRPHAALSAWHAEPVERPTEPTAKTAEKRGFAASATTWLSLALGTAGFVCGGVLMGWSIAAGRQELWTIGLPVALIGQLALLGGLVMQFDRLRRDNRRAADKLENVDDQLHDLKTAATLLSTSPGPGSTAFYSHFAGGANPQLLLTDLKGQLDLLAMKLARDQR